MKWGLCDCGICLYSHASIPTTGRCIKHGALLDWIGARFDNLTRTQVRAKLAAEDKDLKRTLS